MIDANHHTRLHAGRHHAGRQDDTAVATPAAWIAGLSVIADALLLTLAPQLAGILLAKYLLGAAGWAARAPLQRRMRRAELQCRQDLFD